MTVEAAVGSVNGERPLRRYEAPRLVRVDLRAEEVLGVGCKTYAIPGAGSVPPLNYCSTTGCNQYDPAS